MSLTPENIKAINEVIKRWQRGDKNVIPGHPTGAAIFITGLRKLGVDIQRPKNHGWSLEARAASSRRMKERWSQFQEWQASRQEAAE